MSGPAQASVGPGPAVEEVRVAMALNGGVSLAVWMGGGAVELDCARRAHLCEEPMGDFPARTAYHALCGAFARRLVVDVMSGSSAGGINGALLAAAAVHRRRLHPDYLRERWIELGDLGALVRQLSEADPYSLMDGEYFYRELQKTFRAVCWEDRAEPDPEQRNAAPVEPAALDPPPGLDVTTTDVLGDDRHFADAWGGSVTALEYRARFRFRRTEDYQAESLAVAARSSASFPVAFEPFVVRGEEPKRLAGFKKGPRAVIDGGVLDNAPIAAAIELIKARPAKGYVKRYVCYVNGEPKDVTDRKVPEGETDAEREVREEAERHPRLPKVLANVLGLPRKAPFADQLRALDEASWRGGPTQSAELALLGVDPVTLHTTASALLDIYRSRRRLVSLQELVGPEEALDTWSADRGLPWIPATLDPPAAGEWGWGVQAARRVHHLLADLIREAIRTGDPASHPELLAARAVIDAQIAAAERRRTDPSRATGLKAAVKATREDGGELRAEVLASAAAVFEVRERLGVQEQVQIGEALFGPGWHGPALTGEMRDAFLRRVLAIEVVRRAFAMERDIDDGQQFAFAQLTPAAPTPLLDAKPCSEPGTRSPETKLTGIRLAHFSAFHRRSWRANDYLWGRLDGAARVVAMLVDASRAIDVEATRPWIPLAEALTPEGDEVQRVLLEEALADADVPATEGDLRARAAAALEYDLAGRDDLLARGRLTRVLFIRAAQLEILAHELPTLVEEAAEDSAGGASTPPLGLDPRDVLGAVRALRETPTLPGRLGRDGLPEVVSDMALRTVSRSGLVMLAVLRGSTLPLMKPLMVLRAPLLSVSGMVARNRLWRPVVLLAFVAAALLLTARAAAVDDGSSDLDAVSWEALVLALVALVTVLGVLLVPALRALGNRSGDRLVHGAVAGLATLGVLACIAAPTFGTPGIADAVAAGGFDPPWWVAAGPLALVFFTGPVRTLFPVPWPPRSGPAVAAASALLAGGWSAYELLEDDGDLPWWAFAAVAVAIAAVAVYVFTRPRLIAATRRLSRSGAR